MKTLPLYLYALDPTHVGAGGYRLGRVDLSIVREAPSGLPILPGSSLNGALRAAALYCLEDDDDRRRAMAYARATLDGPNARRPHRGADDPVASLFGYAEGDDAGQSRIGVLSFHDAGILAFPVPTVAGPRWIATAARLAEAGAGDCPAPRAVDEILVPQGDVQPERLNLGSLLFQTRRTDLPALPDGDRAGGLEPVLEHIASRLAVVHDDVFSALVNANLETRTSVTLDFETGAAAPQLLFNYEATPRGTLYRTEVGIDGRDPELARAARALLEKALALACAGGLGAMTTRGFGRMRPGLVDPA